MAKVTSKLQVTIPKRIADEHSIVPGDEITFESSGEFIRVVPGKSRLGKSLGVEERLRLFDESTARLVEVNRKRTTGDTSRVNRDWRREDLYDRRDTD